jgi:hypothetical protein
LPRLHERGKDFAMTKAYDKIRRGLTEAIDFAHGKQTGARVRQVDVPAVDVAGPVALSLAKGQPVAKRQRSAPTRSS